MNLECWAQALARMNDDMITDMLKIWLLASRYVKLDDRQENILELMRLERDERATCRCNA